MTMRCRVLGHKWQNIVCVVEYWITEYRYSICKRCKAVDEEIMDGLPQRDVEQWRLEAVYRID